MCDGGSGVMRGGVGWISGGGGGDRSSALGVIPRLVGSAGRPVFRLLGVEKNSDVIIT